MEWKPMEEWGEMGCASFQGEMMVREWFEEAYGINGYMGSKHFWLQQMCLFGLHGKDNLINCWTLRQSSECTFKTTWNHFTAHLYHGWWQGSAKKKRWAILQIRQSIFTTSGGPPSWQHLKCVLQCKSFIGLALEWLKSPAKVNHYLFTFAFGR